MEASKQTLIDTYRIICKQTQAHMESSKQTQATLIQMEVRISFYK